MPITTQFAAANSPSRPENAIASFVHPLVSARGKKKTTTFLPALSASLNVPLSVGMVKSGTVLPVSSILISS